MNLLTVLKLKLQKVWLPQINFSDFAKYFAKNKKVIEHNSKLLMKDYNKWIGLDGVHQEMRFVLQDQEENMVNAKRACNDDFLAPTIVNAIAYTRFYATVYLRTEVGKTDLNAARIMTRLGFIADDVAFETIRYYINQENTLLLFDRENFTFLANEHVKNNGVLKMALDTLNFINHINFAIYEDKSDEAQRLYNEFDLSALIRDADDVFGEFIDVDKLYQKTEDYMKRKEQYKAAEEAIKNGKTVTDVATDNSKEL